MQEISSRKLKGIAGDIDPAAWAKPSGHTTKYMGPTCCPVSSVSQMVFEMSKETYFCIKRVRLK